MSTPCEQTDNIVSINKTLERMEEAQLHERKERRESEKRLMSILEKLADQGARLVHIEEQTETAANNTATLFERVRDLELNYAHAEGPAVRQRLTDSISAVSNKIEGVGKRLDTVSLKLDRLNRFYGVTTHKYALLAYATVFVMILIGTILDFVYHKELLLAIFQFFRG